MMEGYSPIIRDCALPADMLDEDEDDRVDDAALQQLTEMGFPESRAIKALRLNQCVSHQDESMFFLHFLFRLFCERTFAQRLRSCFFFTLLA